MVLHVFRPHVNGIIFMCAETYFFCSFQYDDCGIHPYSHRAVFSFLLLYNIALHGSTRVIYPLLIVPTLLETVLLCSSYACLREVVGRTTAGLEGV